MSIRYGIFTAAGNKLVEGGFSEYQWAADAALDVGWSEAVHVSRQRGHKPIGPKLLKIHPAEYWGEGCNEPDSTGRSAF